MRVAVVLDMVFGMAIPPRAIGPCCTAQGKCSLRLREWHLKDASILSIFLGLKGYSTPGSSIVVTAVHFSCFESLLCLSLPIYVAAMS